MQDIQLLNISFKNPYYNLAFDEVLLDSVNNKIRTELLRIWCSDIRSVVLGITNPVEENVHLSQCRKDNIIILRRFSGGGAVLIDAGCINYTLILSIHRDKQLQSISSAFSYVLKRISESFARKGVSLHINGISDLCLDNRKISGNSQRRGRDYVLIHGTFLTQQFDSSYVTRYIKEPKDYPDYRNHRKHNEFIGKIPAEFREIEQYIIEAFNIENNNTGYILEEERHTLDSLVESKYATKEWNFKF